jgi:hypothetical protein
LPVTVKLADHTWKLTPLLATPFTVTTTLPVVALDGTGTVMLVSLQLVGVPATLLNVTVLLRREAWQAPRLCWADDAAAITEPRIRFVKLKFC